MSEKKETVKIIKDSADTVKDIRGLITDSYLNGLESASSLWEDNLKALNTNMDRWLDLEKDCINTLREFYKKFPKDALTFWNETNITNKRFGRLLTRQKHHIDSFRKTSDKLTKEDLNQTRGDYRKGHYFS